jgi:hypothetical protein
MNYKLLLDLMATAATEKADKTKLQWKTQQLALLDAILLFVTEAETLIAAMTVTGDQSMMLAAKDAVIQKVEFKKGFMKSRHVMSKTMGGKHQDKAKKSEEFGPAHNWQIYKISNTHWTTTGALMLFSKSTGAFTGECSCDDGSSFWVSGDSEGERGL